MKITQRSAGKTTPSITLVCLLVASLGVIQVSAAGNYVLTARVATLQEGQKFQFAANAATTPLELAVPYTIGLWQQTQPLEVTLAKGPNVLNFESLPGSRGVAIKEFTLTPVK